MSTPELSKPADPDRLPPGQALTERPAGVPLPASPLPSQIVEEEPEGDELNLRELWQVIVKRRWTIIIFTLIVLVASSLNGLVSQRAFRIVTRVIIAGILLGILGMFQPWVMAFYTRGFSVLLIATLSYILWSHVTPAFEDVQEEARGGLTTH